MSFAAAQAAIVRARGSATAAMSADTYDAFLTTALATIEDLRVALVRTGMDGQPTTLTIDADGRALPFGLGSTPLLARELVSLFEDLSLPWQTLPTEPTLEPSRVHWFAALAEMRMVVDGPRVTGDDEPSIAVWHNVTLPLIQGVYYNAAPGVPLAGSERPQNKPPGAIIPFTLGYQTAWYGANVSDVQRVLLEYADAWSAGVERMRERIGQLADLVTDAVIDPAKRVGKGLLVAAGIGIAVGIAWLVGKK